jgi:anaerobic magnesium-protoporphyrin IX monomethyl ester cyclase
LGIPTESYEDEVQTIKFAIALAPDYAQFAVLSPFYGTKLYQQAKELGWYDEICVNNPLDKDIKKPVVIGPNWDTFRIRKILRRAYMSFYLRPRYFAKLLSSIKNPSQLLGMIRGFSIFVSWFRTHK